MVFIAQYRVGGGRGSRQRRYTLGVFGKITADEARAKAKDVLARAHLGEDTAEERDKVRRSQTVAQLIDAWSVDGALNNRRAGVVERVKGSRLGATAQRRWGSRFFWLFRQKNGGAPSSLEAIHHARHTAMT